MIGGVRLEDGSFFRLSMNGSFSSNIYLNFAMFKNLILTNNFFNIYNK